MKKIFNNLVISEENHEVPDSEMFFIRNSKAAFMIKRLMGRGFESRWAFWLIFSIHFLCLHVMYVPSSVECPHQVPQ